MAVDRSRLPTNKQIEQYEYLVPMLDSALNEVREFAKRKQDGILSKVKITIINRLLKELREILKNEETLAYLDLLDEEELPQNSDVVVILGQYHAALDSFKKKHRPKDYLGWITKEGHEAKGEEDEEEGDAGEDESTNQ